MATVVMEMAMDAPASEEQIQGMKVAAETCFEINDVERKVTYVSTDKTRFVCIMEARDVESARRALESAKVPYAKIYLADSF